MAALIWLWHMAAALMRKFVEEELWLRSNALPKYRKRWERSLKEEFGCVEIRYLSTVECRRWWIIESFFLQKARKNFIIYLHYYYFTFTFVTMPKASWRTWLVLWAPSLPEFNEFCSFCKNDKLISVRCVPQTSCSAIYVFLHNHTSILCVFINFLL